MGKPLRNKLLSWFRLLILPFLIRTQVHHPYKSVDGDGAGAGAGVEQVEDNDGNNEYEDNDGNNLRARIMITVRF